jgi:Na+/H+ antiporter NhaD/arsenite permease-like protein
VFAALRSWLVRKGLNYRQIFWITGIISFFLSPIADNMTKALVMGAVIMAVGVNSPKFVAISMVNIVCAANAGGAFSPFGDITTLMVWQSGRVEFLEFFALFIPSVITYLVPALIMSFFVPKGQPPASEERVGMKRGAKRAVGFFILTIAMAVSFEQFLGLPPFMGMMTGLSLLMFLAYYLRKTRKEGELQYEIFNAIRLVE